MNKGLQIRSKKLAKKAQTRYTVKPDQIGLCRFIDFKNPKTAKIKGKAQFLGFQNIFGLQIEHKLFYIQNDEISWFYINKKRASILTIYSENEIENFHPLLLKRYYDFKAQREQSTSSED